ncbi:MAG: TIGR00269 family protein [archaeon]|nr:TIGR00269 family protein [archaeon]
MQKCTKCGNPNVIIKRKASGQSLCKECFIKSIEKKVIQTIKKENFIEKGDKVLVALSGGKDSVVTLEILNSYVERHMIELCAVTIDEGIEGYREEGVEIAKSHAKRLGIPHKVVSFKDTFGIDLDEIMALEKHRGSCTYCGVFRRWIINRVAREFGATKIATGHNLDDETQAIMMNYLEGNVENLAKIGPKTESKNELFTIKIKPLREIPEKEIGLYALAKGLDIHLAGCPYAQESFRMEVSNILKDLSKDHPTIMYSTLRGFDKIRPAIRSEISQDYEFDTCERCGEPSSNRLCRACTFLKELNK